MTEDEVKKVKKYLARVKAEQIFRTYLPSIPSISCAERMMSEKALARKYCEADIAAVQEAYEMYKEKVIKQNTNESPS